MKEDKKYQQYLLKFSFPIIVSGIFMTMANVITNIMISYMGTDELLAKNIFSKFNTLYLAFNSGFALIFANYYFRFLKQETKNKKIFKLSIIGIGIISICIMIIFILFRKSLFSLYCQEENAITIFCNYSMIRALCFPIIGIHAFLDYILSENNRKRILVGNIIALIIESVLVWIVVFKTNLDMQAIAIIEIFARMTKLLIFISPYKKYFKVKVLDEFKIENIRKIFNINKNVIMVSFITFMNVFIGMFVLKLYSYIDALGILCITISEDILKITSNLFVALSRIVTTQISPEISSGKEILKRRIKNIYKYINKIYIIFFVITILFSIGFLRLYNIDYEMMKNTIIILWIQCVLYIATPLTDFHILLLKIKMNIKKLFISDTIYDFIILCLSFLLYKIFSLNLIEVVFVYNLLLFIQTIVSKRYTKEIYE